MNLDKKTIIFFTKLNLSFLQCSKYGDYKMLYCQFRDAEMASVGQLLDVILDLEKVHDAYERMELEKQRHSFRSDTSQQRE